MDFRHHIALPSKLSTLAADSLVVVVAGGQADETLDPVLRQALDLAVKSGDFQFKAGRTLYLHGLAGVKASRIVFTAAAHATPKAFKVAVAAALAVLKSGGGKQVAVALSGGGVSAAHAEVLVAAASEATYVYRHTKPSAPAEPAFRGFGLVCVKSEVTEVQKGLVLGQALAAGVTLARECANRPGNQCTPTF